MKLVSNKPFWISFLAVFLLSFFLLHNIDQPIPGMTSIGLVAGCQLELLDTTTQPNFTALLACPGKDYIRLWPLPVTQPWFEDWYEAPAPRDDIILGIVSQSSTFVISIETNR
jgi:hypothetical protein